MKVNIANMVSSNSMNANNSKKIFYRGKAISFDNKNFVSMKNGFCGKIQNDTVININGVNHKFAAGKYLVIGKNRTIAGFLKDDVQVILKGNKAIIPAGSLIIYQNGSVRGLLLSEDSKLSVGTKKYIFKKTSKYYFDKFNQDGQFHFAKKILTGSNVFSEGLEMAYLMQECLKQYRKYSNERQNLINNQVEGGYNPVSFDHNENLISAVLKTPQKFILAGKNYVFDDEIIFHSNGSVKKAYIAYDGIYDGRSFKKGNSLFFDQNGKLLKGYVVKDGIYTNVRFDMK